MPRRYTPKEIRAKFEAAREVALDRLADMALDEATSIIQAEAFDEGTLSRSGEIRNQRPGERILAHTAGHALFVHEGTRPHWPPLEPILAWVKRNLATVDGELVLKPGTESNARRAPGAAQLRVAKAIQAKIARHGTKGVFFQTRAAAKVRPLAAGLVQEAIREQFT